jgi:phosphoenolpyruvate carboxykinase (ATP)
MTKTEGMNKKHAHSTYGLDNHGLEPSGQVHWNLNPAELYEDMIRMGEGTVTKHGAIRVKTGKYTGRSPLDKYFVRVPGSETEKKIDWGPVNQACSQELFDDMAAKVRAHLSGKDELWVVDASVGADERYALPLRVVSEAPYHALFSWNMFRRLPSDELASHEPQFTVLAAPTLEVEYEIDGKTKDTFIGVDLDAKLIVIVASKYSGEVKKGMFTVMNYMLPAKGIMPMHCSANIGDDGTVAAFFGLSGTGKTTLSADASRTLIGDDEHGWSDDGLFNFEAGCYAKTINLSREGEPEIYATTEMFGTILENIPLREDRSPDFDDTRYTQNTRCSYPLHYIPNASETAMAGHPKHVIFLAADAFGVLPPVSKLTPGQMMYHFISGYTAKLAGTEIGVNTPKPIFSTCFGGPFMALHPTAYAELLAAKVKEHDVNVWLVNTGWTGGEYGTGERMSLKHTRSLVNAILDGNLEDVEFVEEPFFGLAMPASAPGVPAEILNPRNTWPDKDGYDVRAKELAGMFKKNFEKYADKATDEIMSGGPKA